MAHLTQPREWHYSAEGHDYLTSTDASLLDDDFIQSSFASDGMYWARPMAASSIAALKETSCFFGLYLREDGASKVQPQNESEDASQQSNDPKHKQSLKQVGMARLVTDYVTIAFLTDVYVLPDHQGAGLGRWLVQCVRDRVVDMPELRRVMLMAKRAPHAIKFYQDILGAEVFAQETQQICFMSSKLAGVDNA